MMFAYILKASIAPNEQTEEFFRRFTQTPGLLRAYDLQSVDDSNESAVVAIWQSREAAERYLAEAPLRKEVDAAVPAVTRTMYNVRGSK